MAQHIAWQGRQDRTGYRALEQDRAGQKRVGQITEPKDRQGEAQGLRTWQGIGNEDKSR